MPAAVRALGTVPRRVFLALGRNELRPFEAAPQHFYLVRSVDPVEPPLALPHADLSHRPRAVRREPTSTRCCMQHRIDVIVAKNSGGDGDLRQDRSGARLGLPVIMLAGPRCPHVPAATSVEEALARLDHALASARRPRRIDQGAPPGARSSASRAIPR